MSEGELRLYKDLVNAERVSHIDFKLIAKKLFDELQQKENIMKEVREYIEEHIKYECDDAFNGNQFYSYHLYDFDEKELLEILDKVKLEK